MDLPKFTPFMLKNQPDQTAYLLNKLSAGSGGGGGKLYNTTGTNTDGAMTQKATTDALGTKANAVDVGNALAGKVDKEPGKGLSTNDFTDADEAKLDGIEAGAQVNVQADWDEADTTADSYIQNKPTIPAAQVNSDWNAVSGVAEILNKPTIPTNTSDLVNDSGFLVPGDDVSELVNDANYLHPDTPGTPTSPTPTVGTSGIMDSAITTAKINDEAVTPAKLADDAVTTAKIADGSVTPDKIDWTTEPCKSTFIFQGSAMTADVITRKTRRGTDIEFTMSGNAFYISNGASSINKVRYSISYDYASASTGPYGCIGVYPNSTLWTTYTGMNNGTAVNAGANNTTDTDSNIGSLFTANGVKSRFSSTIDLIRAKDSSYWTMFGSIQSAGSVTSFTVRCEITPQSSGVVPAWYQRSVASTDYYIVVEVWED